MKRIAVIGAGGFVGARLVEMAMLSREFEVVPVIRSLKSAARLARFGRCWVQVDASNCRALCPAIAGCDAVVNLALGDFDTMTSIGLSVWDACSATHIPLLIHLSSAEVFGRVENPNLNDDSPPLQSHWMEYGRCKAAAEMALRSRFENAGLACVILRPGLIWGPRSSWTATPAAQLAAGSAFLLDQGRGICNLIYLDNLLRSILGVAEARPAQSGCYNVSDDETLTWADYYRGLSGQMETDFARIHQLPPSKFPSGVEDRLESLRATPLGKHLKRGLSKGGKQRIKRILRLLRKSDRSTGLVPMGQPQVSRNDWHLQNTRHKLSTAKFTAAFGRLNQFSFADAMSLTGQWLRFAGYVDPWECEPAVVSPIAL